jgi:hypothetical protein
MAISVTGVRPILAGVVVCEREVEAIDGFEGGEAVQARPVIVIVQRPLISGIALPRKTLPSPCVSISFGRLPMWKFTPTLRVSNQEQMAHKNEGLTVVSLLPSVSVQKREGTNP